MGYVFFIFVIVAIDASSRSILYCCAGSVHTMPLGLIVVNVSVPNVGIYSGLVCVEVSLVSWCIIGLALV